MPLVSPIDLFTNSLMVLGIVGAAQAAPRAEDAELCRRTYNRMVGQWNTQKRFSSFIQEQSFTFAVARLSYTIGAAANVPTPNFVVSSGNAPANIQSAQVVITGLSGPDVQLGLAIINQDQWTLITIPALPATFPNTLYYIRPGGGTLNGTLRPWPAFPTATSYKLNLSWWNQLGPVSATDLITQVALPDGYEEALTLTLAEKLYLSFAKRTDLEELKRQARLARADIQSLNVSPPKISTTDGVTSSRASGYNWLSRLPG